MNASWDPDQYLRFQAWRDRPAQDLLTRVPDGFAPREVWDLGCGHGAHAAGFAERWPEARVRGLDSSPEMLGAARAASDRVAWVEGDLAAWSPDAPVDLLFSNAAVQWVGDHQRLIPRLAGTLADGGLMLVQAPMSFEAPQHALLRETAADGPWAAVLADVGGVRPLLAPEAYHDLLASFGGAEVWTTTYLHTLTGEDPVVEWMNGTGLRPYLAALTPPEREAFLAAYRARLSRAFPRRPDGTTLLPFPRLFLALRARRR